MNFRFLATTLTCAALALAPAKANETDYSDLWWNPAESGWGVGVQRQGDVIFATLFIYGTDGSATWLVAPEVRQVAETSQWTGSLYRATGPAFTASYDQAAQAVQAGTATFEFTGPSQATLRYTVDGATVTKQITRMTWREPSAAGRYYGGFSTLTPSCLDPTRIGAYDFLGTMEITQSGREMTAVWSSGAIGGPSRCTFTGTLDYSGRLASWEGTFNCNIYIGLDDRGENPASRLRRGNFSMRELTFTSAGLSGLVSAADQDCPFSGYFGGTRLP